MARSRLDSRIATPPESRRVTFGPGDGVTFFTLSGLYLVLLAGKFSVGTVDIRWFLMAAGVFGAAVLALQPRQGHASRPISQSVAALCGWLCLSSLWSPTGARLGTVLPDLFFLALATVLSCFYLQRASAWVLEKLWWLFFFTGLIYAAGALAQGASGAQGRLSAFGGGPNVFVRVICLGLLASVALAASTRWGRWTVLATPIFILCAVLSGSRGGLVALAVTLSAAGWLALRDSSPKIRLATLAGSLALAGASYFFVWPRAQDFIQKRFIDETLNQGYSSGRSDISSQCIELFRNNPIAGVGIDGYWALKGFLSGYQYPHNIVLGAAAEGGIISVALLLLAAAVGFVRGMRPSAGVIANMPAMSALFILAASQFSGYWYDTRFLWFFLAFAAESLSRVKQPQ